MRLVEVADVIGHVQPLPPPLLDLDGTKGSLRLTVVVRKPEVVEQPRDEVLLNIALVPEVLELAELVLRLPPPNVTRSFRLR